MCGAVQAVATVFGAATLHTPGEGAVVVRAPARGAADGGRVVHLEVDVDVEVMDDVVARRPPATAPSRGRVELRFAYPDAPHASTEGTMIFPQCPPREGGTLQAPIIPIIPPYMYIYMEYTPPCIFQDPGGYNLTNYAPLYL